MNHSDDCELHQLFTTLARAIDIKFHEKAKEIILTNAAFSRPSIDGQSSPRAEQMVASHAFKFFRKIVA